MYERFTERARQVVILAQEECRKHNHSVLGTDFILLGLIREEEGLASRVLKTLGITYEAASSLIESQDDAPASQIPFTPRTKMILERSLREALSLGHNYIGTEHILLALTKEERGPATDIIVGIMHEHEFALERVRDEVIRMLSGPTRHEKAKVNEPAEVGHTLRINNAMFIENDRGYHQFVANMAGGGNKPKAGLLHIPIPIGADPLAFQYGDRVNLTIEKIEASNE